MVVYRIMWLSGMHSAAKHNRLNLDTPTHRPLALSCKAQQTEPRHSDTQAT
jgi:hypothetical protein